MFATALSLLYFALFQGAAPPPAACRVHGNITLGETGKTVAGLPIALEYRTYSEFGEPKLEILEVERSNDHGAYSLSARARGHYRIATGTMDAEGKAYLPVEVALPKSFCSAEQQADIPVHEGREVTIAGKFIDGLGHRYPHLDWVWLDSIGPVLRPVPLSATASTAETWRSRYRNAGGYRIESVLPGSYTLHSFRFDDVSNRAETVIPIEVRDTDLNVDIVSDASYQLTGRIRFEGARFPLIGETLPRVAILPVRPKYIGVITAVPVGRDGTFGFSSVPEGTFRLSITNVPPPFYLKSIRRGGVDALQNGIELPGKSAESVSVVIASDGGRITGFVERSPGSHAAVVLVPQQAGLLRSDLYRVGETDTSGHFELRGIAPGRYQIYAWPLGDIGWRDYFDPDFLRQFEGRGTPVQVTTNGDLNVTLPLLKQP